MELAINLEFSESLNEFKYQCITPANEGDFKTVCDDFSYTVAQNFVLWLRDEFDYPLDYETVLLNWDVYKLRNIR